MQNIKLSPPQINYTGEGFKGEKFLALAAVSLTIISSALLIHLSLLQRKHIKEQMALTKKKREEEEENKKNQTKKT